MKFDTLDQLMAQSKKDDARSWNIQWLKEQSDLDTVLRECPRGYRLWAISNGYDQFAEHCDWSELNCLDWCELLVEQPQFAEHCDWDKLYGHHWSYLLSEQPQLVEHCNWSKLDGWDWSCLLIKQPQLSKYCKWWGKLAGWNWEHLLHYQPQFAKYREEK